MVISVAEGERIAAVLPELRRTLRRPLLTLERVQALEREGEHLPRPSSPLLRRPAGHRGRS